MNNEISRHRSMDLARAVVSELGGPCRAARLVGIKQPSVTLWVKRGLGLVRENDLRFRFPELQAWKRFPPLTDQTDKSVEAQ